MNLPRLSLVCPLVCACLASAACSVDRYTLKGRVVSGPPGAESMRASAADDLREPGVPYATVHLVVDADDSLNRRELGVVRCDAAGRFEVRDVNAPGVEVVPYALRVSAHAQRFAPLRCDTGLPGPGRALVLRMAADEGAPGAPPAPAPRPGAKPGDDVLRDTLKESEPYLK